MSHDNTYWNSPQHDSDIRDAMYKDKQKRDHVQALEKEVEELKIKNKKLVAAGNALVRFGAEIPTIEYTSNIQWNALVREWQEARK